MPKGGRRAGAGRPKGALTRRTQAVAEEAIARGKTPLEIMLKNMEHFQSIAEEAEATIAGMSVDQITGEVGEQTPEEQFKFLLAKAKHAAGVRQMAHECARDAAPYVHARLNSTTLSAGPGDTFVTILAMINQNGKDESIKTIEHKKPEPE